MNHTGICPCGCEREVPHNHFWATDACRQRARRKSATRMPRRYESKRRSLYKAGVLK